MTTAQVATAHRLPSNVYLQRLVELLPGYRDALNLAEQADAALRKLPAVPDVPAELDPHVSGQITQEWLTAVMTHETAAAQYQKQRQLIATVKQRATGNAMSIFASNVNGLLRGLNDDLTRLLAEVSVVDRELGGADTAEQAVTLDAAPAWKRLRDLAVDYDTLRDAQTYLLLNVASRTYWTSCRPILGGEDHANLAYIRNLDDVWSDWRRPGLHTQRINVDGSKHRTEPWPADSGPELLLWLVRSPAKPWIPTLPQIDELFAELRARDNAPQQPQPQREVLNQPPRADYFDRIAPELTSVSPPAELAELETFDASNLERMEA
jgi:hypothetical protein